MHAVRRPRPTTPARLRGRLGAVGAVGLAGALALTGCTAEETPAPSATEPPPSASSEEDPADDAPDEPADEAGSGGGADCLEGRWVPPADRQEQTVLDAPGMGDMGAEVSVSSDAYLVLEDGQMRSEYEDQTTEVRLTVEGQEIVTSTTWDGVITGSYTATDTELTVTDVDSSGATLESTSTVNGEDLELPDQSATLDETFELGGTSTYTCDDTTLTLTPQVEGVDTTGFQQVFTRD